MARHLRVEFPGAIYHVTCRMVGSWRAERNRLFRDEKDYQRFLARLAERVEQHNVRLFLFVCMVNHVHLVFETPEANCSKFMHALSTAYTVYYNLRHDRHGHLLDGRYKAKLVEGDEYLLALTRYVHLNPVHVGPMKHKALEERMQYLRRYRWSSYPGYIGRRKRLDFVQYGPVLGLMSGKRREWSKQYRRFVESGLAQTDEEFMATLKESPRCIGGDGFRAWVDELYHELLEKHRRAEDVAFRHTTEPVEPETVLDVLADVFKVEVMEFSRRRRNSPLRAAAARLLMRFAAQSQRDVAERLNAGSGSAISKQLSRHAEAFEKDHGLKRKLREARRRLMAIKQERTAAAIKS